jgi:hypothetical protein
MNAKIRNFLINGAVAIALFILISNIPAKAPITPLGMKLLGIVAGAIYGWCFIGPVIPSLAAVIIFGSIMKYSAVFCVLFYLVIMIIGYPTLSYFN